MKQIKLLLAGVAFGIFIAAGVFDEAGAEQQATHGWCYDICSK